MVHTTGSVTCPDAGVASVLQQARRAFEPVAACAACAYQGSSEGACLQDRPAAGRAFSTAIDMARAQYTMFAQRCGTDASQPCETATRHAHTSSGSTAQRTASSVASWAERPADTAASTSSGEASTSALATAEQAVADPSADQTGSAMEPKRQEGQVSAALRGESIVRKMSSWQEMGKWLMRFESDKNLYPTEISRIWTQIVQVRCVQAWTLAVCTS